MSKYVLTFSVSSTFELLSPAWGKLLYVEAAGFLDRLSLEQPFLMTLGAVFVKL